MAKCSKEPIGDSEEMRNYPPPARTSDRRAQQLVIQAQDLVESRMRDGTASPTEVVAVLKMGTAIELANVERVKAHTEYLAAQKAKAESETVREELFTQAIAAMSRYQGQEVVEDYDSELY